MKNKIKIKKNIPMKSSEIKEIYTLFNKLSNILKVNSLYETHYLISVAQTSFEDALCLRTGYEDRK